ncbi:MAG: SDR family NAD(P)-dependent oxidoreductase [Acidimicrobiia bacterium]|nr:SDR family NAD(P)-dependent oxidoreductase [Acidimicrobiia bacterium]NNL98899.1 SDR family NAD(P)-dependent oxidoreductase [Acidimicrobiia bacterium]
MEPTTSDRLFDTSVVLGFSRLGYGLRSRGFEPLPSMAGKTVVITGPTAGLGKAAAEHMAALDADLVLVARNPDKTAAVAAELDGMGAGSIRSEIADLSLMAEVRALGERLADEDRIDVLVNNAGSLFTERGVTSEGLEQTFALNLLGHFLLTNLLVPALVSSAPSRVINVTSGGMYTQRIRVRDLQWERQTEWNGSAAYARTKRGQVILTEMWAEALGHLGVTFHSMHPGWADTPGVQKSLPAFRLLTRPILRTPAQGADTIVWLAAAKEALESNGLFWHDRVPRPTHRSRKTSAKPGDREELWTRLSELSGWTEDQWPAELRS